MEKCKRVVLCGNSVVMSSLALSLGRVPNLETARINFPVGDFGAELEAAQPDVVIYDRNAPHPDLGICFVERHPAVVILALDQDHAQILKLSGQEAPVLTADDLVGIIGAD